jgi:hypothetical protein
MVDEGLAEAAARAVDADEVLTLSRALIAAPSENPESSYGLRPDSASVPRAYSEATVRGGEPRMSFTAYEHPIPASDELQKKLNASAEKDAKRKARKAA